MTEEPHVAGTKLAYLSRREAQERALADRAADPVAQRLHRELAERYAALMDVSGSA